MILKLGEKSYKHEYEHKSTLIQNIQTTICSSNMYTVRSATITSEYSQALS